jgi:DNA topoisomerase-3
MILCIAEKPSVARELAKVLAPSARKNDEGFWEGNGIVFAHARGHLCALKTPVQIDAKYKRWSYDHLPLLPTTIPVTIREGCSKEFALLKKMLKDNNKFNYVVCATDAGREGQYIFDLIYQHAKSKLPVKRLWLSAFTEESIKRAWSNMKDIDQYQGLSCAAKLRSYADWYVGMNASPAVSLAAGPTINVGRVMTPTLKLIVDRTKENENFVPETYYQIIAEFDRQYQGTLLIEHGDVFYTTKNIQEAQKIISRVKNSQGKIIKIKRERQKESPPKLFNLGDLQVAASKALGFTAQKTLDLAQKLYETHKCLSYPRTNSRHIDETMVGELPQLIRAVSHLEQVASIAQNILAKPLPRLNKNYVDSTKVTDHHCLLPTSSPANWGKLSPDEKALFLLVVKRFLAIFFPAAEYDKKTILTEILDAPECIFRTTGRQMVKTGWKVVYGAGQPDENAEEKSAVLPPLAEGEIRPVTKAEMEEKQTKPRPLYDDGTIIKAMQNVSQELEDDLKKQLKSLELGTEATRAAIIEKLIKIKMIERKGRGKIKNLVATPFGINAINAICDERLKSPMLTAEWEMKLTEIEAGKLSDTAFMTELSQYIHEMIATLKATPVRLIKDSGKSATKQTEKTYGTCPFCGHPVVGSPKAFGCSNWRNGCKFTIWKKIAGKQIPEEAVEKLIATGKTEKMTGFTSRAGKPFSAALVIKEDRTIGFEF